MNINNLKKSLSVGLAYLLLTSNSWALLSEAKTGAVQSNNGAVNAVRSDKSSALVTTEAHGRYQEANLQGNVYVGADLGGTPVTTQPNLTETNPPLTLYNPPGSGVNLVLLSATVDITASPAAATGFMLAYSINASSAPTTTTLATVTPGLLGNTKLPIGQCYRAALLPTLPVAFRFIGGTTGASAIGGVSLIDHVDGEVIVTPGNMVSIQSTAAAAVLASFTWEEVPQ